MYLRDMNISAFIYNTLYIFFVFYFIFVFMSRNPGQNPSNKRPDHFLYDWYILG